MLRLERRPLESHVGEACPECGKFHPGPERHMPQVRHLRRHDGVLVSRLVVMTSLNTSIPEQT
jgi:hypothetical protein